MNKKGIAGLAILISIVYFFSGMILYQLLKPTIAVTRVELSCTVPDTMGDMATCLIIDGIVPYFIIGVLAIAGGTITNYLLK